MAVRRHIIAARNTTPEAFAAALASLKVSEVEAVNGWCWVMASVWLTGSHELLLAADALDGPVLLVTTEDASRWRLHLRAKGLPPFDTVHEFHWISRDRHAAAVEEDDWSDFSEEVEEPGNPVVVELPGFPPLPGNRLAPLDFEDEFFEPYTDDEEEEEEETYRDYLPWESIVAAYDGNGSPLPPDIVDALPSLPNGEVYSRFLALHGAYIADALDRFGIAHDHVETLRILTGESVTAREMDSDVGNLWRFLDHLGLGPKFAEAVAEYERVKVPPQEPEDPALRIIKATGKLPLHELEGGPVRVPLRELFLMARLTYYQDNHPVHVLCVRFDSAVDWPSGKTPSYATCYPVKRGFGVNISLDGVNAPVLPKVRHRMGELCASLPDGTRLELLAKGRYTRVRLFGRVDGGTWLIDSASVPLTADEVGEMLTIFRAAEVGGPQIARDGDEAEAILDSAAHHISLCNDPPHRDGLQLQSDGRNKTEVLGSLLFRRRFAHRWDFGKINADTARYYKDWRKFEEELARQNAMPATDRVVYTGEASRFLEADYKSRAMDHAMRAKAGVFRETDAAMAELGYTLLGAVVCEKVGGGILRCYANAGERTFSTSYLLPFGQVWHDFCTRFSDDVSLTTGNGLTEGSLRSLRILARHSAAATLGEMHDEHREGIERLAGHGLTPAEIDPSLEGVCRAMDDFLTLRLGLESEC